MRGGVAGLVLASLLVVSPGYAQDSVDTEARTAIERTRTTGATYSVFTWNRLTQPGMDPIEEWSAEFHDGSLHRVETPRDRLIADCAAGTGTHLSLVTGERVSGPTVARAACGVHANARILAASHDGQTNGRLGTLDHITVRDANFVRGYAIAANGAIVGATIAEPDGTLLLQSRAVELRDGVVDGIFSADSLDTGFVPEEFRRPPAGLDWSVRD